MFSIVSQHLDLIYCFIYVENRGKGSASLTIITISHHNFILWDEDRKIVSDCR